MQRLVASEQPPPLPKMNRFTAHLMQLTNLAHLSNGVTLQRGDHPHIPNLVAIGMIFDRSARILRPPAAHHLSDSLKRFTLPRVGHDQEDANSHSCSRPSSFWAAASPR
jgi:hypothetical protein